MNYITLTDAGIIRNDSFFDMGKKKIWYTKPEFLRDAVFSDRSFIDIKDLTKSHVLLGEIVGSDDLEFMYCVMQGENWSSEGEARDLIIAKGLRHTSMSMGDIFELEDGSLFIVASLGFDKLK